MPRCESCYVSVYGEYASEGHIKERSGFPWSLMPFFGLGKGDCKRAEESEGAKQHEIRAVFRLASLPMMAINIIITTHCPLDLPSAFKSGE